MTSLLPNRSAALGLLLLLPSLIVWRTPLGSVRLVAPHVWWALLLAPLGVLFLVLGMGVALKRSRVDETPQPWRRRVLGPALWLALVTAAWVLGGMGGAARYALRVDGRTRIYHVHQPSRGKSPWPAVVLLHGSMLDGRLMERISGLDRTADAEGFLAVYPEGYHRGWNDGDPRRAATRDRVDDVGFLLALADELVARRGADPRRLYLAGFSNGGFFALAHAGSLASRYARLAVVAAGVPRQDDALAVRPAVATLLVMGTDDPFLPWSLPSGAEGPALQGSGRRWAGRMGCANAVEALGPSESALAGPMVRAQRYAGCPGGVEVIACVVAGAGHTWAGGRQFLPPFVLGRTAYDWALNAALWAFFRRA